MKSTNYLFVVKEYDTAYLVNSKIFNERAIGIGLMDIERRMVFPSPLTNFIKANYRRRDNNSLSSQRNAASEIVKFLNYLRNRIKLNDSDFTELKHLGIQGINLTHGSNYISYLSLRAREGSLDSNYVYRIESYLVKFYEWLSKSNIIKSYHVDSIYSPFEDIELGTIYPGNSQKVKNKLVDFGENRFGLTQDFINTAQLIAPDIVLGICFQFFGGLRAGEVVNLTKDSIEYPYYWSNRDTGNDKFIIKIRDRHEILFPNKKNLQHEQVKRPRNQSLLVNEMLSNVFVNHKRYLQKIESSLKTKDSTALFLSKTTGTPISGKSYKEKFQRVKTEFLLGISKAENVKDYQFLADKNWSTHIGRGVFTNFLLEIGGTIPEVAIARGDKNINSVLAYVEERNAIKLTSKAINEIRKSYEDEITRSYMNNNAEIKSNLQTNIKKGFK
ncbi:MAG: hypothetical protein ACQEV7_06950 [Bacillota bacterium]